jgi:hypothetical protein
MSSSRTITLFSERPESSQRPSSFLVSILAHGVAVALVSFGIIYTPVINEHLIGRPAIHDSSTRSARRKSMRASPRRRALPIPALIPTSTIPHRDRSPLRMKPCCARPRTPSKGMQTLIQPDLPDPVNIAEETPVPTVVIWSPKKEQVKILVAPLPEKGNSLGRKAIDESAQSRD